MSCAGREIFQITGCEKIVIQAIFVFLSVTFTTSIRMSLATCIKGTIRFTIIFLLVCYFGLIALINLSGIQRRLSDCVSAELSSLLQTEVTVGNIDLGFLNRIIIQNVKINDRQNREMFRVSRISATFDMPSLFHRKISISSVQLFGLDIRMNRENPDMPLNCQFIIDAFAPKDTVKKEMNIDLRINSVLIRRGQISYDVVSVPETKGRFNPGHIAINDLSATVSLKALRTDSLNLQLRRMSFNEQSGLQLKRFRFRLTANRERITLGDFSLALPGSVLSVDTFLISDFSPDEFPNINEQIRYSGNARATVTPADLSMFFPALSHFSDTVGMQMRFFGRGKRLSCPEFVVSGAGKEVMVRAEGTLDANSNTLPPYLYGNVSQVYCSEEGMKWLVRNINGGSSIPSTLERMKFLRFGGQVSGYPTKFTAHGLLQIDPGYVNANVTMYTDTLNGVKTLSGQVASEDFGLGQLLGKENQIGKASFNLELKDLKYSNRQFESYIKGTVTALEYNNYTYSQIVLDGNVRPGCFNGHMSIDDPNGSVRFDGSFVTDQVVPAINLKAVMKNFRPNRLNLTNKYEDTEFSLNLTADFRGNSIDDMLGQITIDSLTIDSEDNNLDFFMPYFNITAGSSESDDGKAIRINSPFLHGTLQGQYSYRSIAASIRKLIRKYIPSLLSEGRETHETSNKFRFSLSMENSDILSKAFNIPLTLQMPANLNGHVNDSTGDISISGYLPQFSYNGNQYEAGTLLCKNTNDTLECQFRLSALMKKGIMFNFSLFAQANDDRMHTTLYWGNNAQKTFSGKLDAVTTFFPKSPDKPFGTRIDINRSEIVLNDTVWHVHPATVSLAKDSIEIRNFLFEHADQHLRINGRIGKTDNDSCIAELKNIGFRYIMDMVQFHDVSFDGQISGKAQLLHLLKEPSMKAKLKIDNFLLNGALLGNADVTGMWNNEAEGIHLYADIRKDKDCTTIVDGHISPKQKGLDLNIQAGGTPLSFLQPFVQKIFDGVYGEAYGRVRLFGPFSQLDLEGAVKARMGMKVGILNTGFEAHADSVRITPGEIRFTDVRISDTEGHMGTANGTLYHSNMKDIRYRFSFNTDNMLVYNTSASTPEFPFYGQIYTTGNILIRGGRNQLNVDGTVRADAQTNFFYVFGSAAEATNSGFITFVDHTPRRKQLDTETEIYHYLNAKTEKNDEGEQTDVYINLQIEPTEQASMRIIMDPAAGDNILAHGTGNLRINFFNKGDFQIFGTYNITDGIYKMSLQNVIRKDFTLQPGGTVTFNGNPRNATMNVQAVYTVNSASLNDLIADASSSKGNVRVNCLLNLSGNLTSPDLKFDIELPTVSDEDQELVRSLTSTEEQMNTQIIYLLSVGKFYTYDIAAENSTMSDPTSSLAFNTLSGQLNNMLSEVINSQNWNIGTNLTTGERGWSDVEAEAILSGRLLNNRLIINGNFGYRENILQNTNFVGDFEAIWLLTPSGEFRLRGYNETNDRYFTKSTLTTQGIGLIYNKDFSHWSELLDWFLRRRRNRSTQQKQEDENKAAAQNETTPSVQNQN